MKPIKRAAVIHDLCGMGKAAMTNIIPVLSVMGIEACPVPTTALSTHTGGFGRPAVHHMTNFVREAADHFKSQGISFDYIFAGYCGNVCMTEEVRYFLDCFPRVQVLLDPIMGDHGKYYGNFNEEYKRAIAGLLPYASVITPNYTEGCLLTDEECMDTADDGQLERIWEKLRKMGVGRAVLTGIPLEGYPQSMAVCEGRHMRVVKRGSTGKSYPGTGDLFAAVLLGNLMKDAALYEAVERSHDFVSGCIQESDRAGYPAKEGVLLEPRLLDLLEN